MLYGESKQYLIGKLQGAGLKSKPHTTQKTLEKSQDPRVGAVLFESEGIRRNGSKTLYNDQEGARKKRRKVFDRDLAFTIIVGGYSDDEVEGIFEKLLESFDTGIYVDGNFVPIEVEGADWVDSDDSILKAKVAVQVKVTFRGGVYKDTDFAKLKEVVVEAVDKERSL